MSNSLLPAFSFDSCYGLRGVFRTKESVLLPLNTTQTQYIKLHAITAIITIIIITTTMCVVAVSIGYKKY